MKHTLSKNILHTHKKARNITSLDLSDNYFCGDGEIEDLADSLCWMQSLFTLNLANGMKMICQSLSEAGPPVEDLNLSCNDLTEDGAETVAEYLHECDTIVVFSAEDNELRSTGATALINALAHKDQLQHIRLSGNTIGAHGAKAIVEAHKGEAMPALRQIYLNANHFTQACTKTLKDTLGFKLVDMDENHDENDSNFEGENEDEHDGSVNAEVNAEVNALALQVKGNTLGNSCGECLYMPA